VRWLDLLGLDLGMLDDILVRDESESKLSFGRSLTVTNEERARTLSLKELVGLILRNEREEKSL